MSSTLFLRRVLALDALTCIGAGILLAAAAGPLAPMFGLPQELVRGAGLLLVPIAAFMGLLASRSSPSPLLVWVVIIGNLAWLAESFALIGHYGVSITAIGTTFVAVQALTVLVFAGLEFVGIRRSRAPV